MQPYEIQKHFVTFKSPGMATAEQTTKEIDAWDTLKAVEMAYDILERHGAKPYGFHFSTRARSAQELDSKTIAKSGTYFMGGKITTLQEVIADPINNEILIANMKGNHWDQVVTVTKGYEWTSPILKDDAVLDMNWL